MNLRASTNRTTNRTQEQAVADQIDCDLDRLVRRALMQTGRAPTAIEHWTKVASQLNGVRALVRQRMHEDDRKATS